VSIEVKCGRGLRDFVLENIYSSRRVFIVSPWISRETAKILVDLASRGVEVSLITTNDPLPSHVKGLTTLIRVEKRLKKPGKPRLARAGLCMLIVGLIVGGLLGIALPLLGVAGVALFITGLLLFLRYTPVFEEHYYPRIRELIVTSSKLHAKIILTESAVGLGSLNFTEAGLTENIECFTWIREPSIYSKILEDVNALKSTLQREALSYKSVYLTSKRLKTHRRRH
jgi:phosphatidylserine/phosphatidylglycerophosphate/cardiolipin synthase-like enzyme